MSEYEKTYMQTYEDFWKELVETDGKLDLDKVARELSDYCVILNNVSEVYCHVTGSRISKPNTSAGAVIAEADDYSTKMMHEEVVEELNSIKQQACDLVDYKQTLKQIEEFFDKQIEESRKYAF